MKTTLKSNCLLAFSACLVTSCSNPDVATIYKKQLQSQNVTAYNPPQGNPASQNSWWQYGPGSIIQVSDGVNVVTADDMLAPIVLRDAMTEHGSYGLITQNSKYENGLQLSGSLGAASGSLQTAKAELGVERDENIEIQFINPRLSRPRSIGFMEQRLLEKWSSMRPRDKAGILSGELIFVHDVVIADGVKYNFKRTDSTNTKLDVVLTEEQKASLAQKGVRTHNNGILLEQPFFVGYSPLNISRIRKELAANHH